MRLAIGRPGNMARVDRYRCSAGDVGGSSGDARLWTGHLLQIFTASG